MKCRIILICMGMIILLSCLSLCIETKEDMQSEHMSGPPDYSGIASEVTYESGDDVGWGGAPRNAYTIVLLNNNTLLRFKYHENNWVIGGYYNIWVWGSQEEIIRKELVNA